LGSCADVGLDLAWWSERENVDGEKFTPEVHGYLCGVVHPQTVITGALSFGSVFLNRFLALPLHLHWNTVFRQPKEISNCTFGLA
jgi:hypothetical protein